MPRSEAFDEARRPGRATQTARGLGLLLVPGLALSGSAPIAAAHPQVGRSAAVKRSAASRSHSKIRKRRADARGVP